MATDFAAEGLLDGLDDDARTAREELLGVLEEEGVSVEDMRSAANDGRLMFLLAERAVGGAPRYSAREVADKTGLSLERLTALRRAQGLPVPDPDASVFSDTDLDAARNAIAFEEAGVPFDQQLAVVRVLGRGLGQAAEAMRSTVLELVLQPGATEAELARSYGKEVEKLLPLVGPALDQILRIHLRQMVRTEAISAAERLEGSLPGARQVSVAFADLVGFTRLGEEVAPDELSPRGRPPGRADRRHAARRRAPGQDDRRRGDAHRARAGRAARRGPRPGRRRRRRGRGLPAAARGRRQRRGAQPRRRLVRAPGEPRQPPHRHRPSRLGPRHARGARRRARRRTSGRRRAGARSRASTAS